MGARNLVYPQAGGVSVDHRIHGGKNSILLFSQVHTNESPCALLTFYALLGLEKKKIKLSSVQLETVNEGWCLGGRGLDQKPHRFLAFVPSLL